MAQIVAIAMLDRMKRRRSGLIASLRRLDRRRALLLAEAAVTLAVVSTALQLLPFRRAIRLGALSLGDQRQYGSIEACVWAVEAAARRLPWRIVCIQKGIAAQRMLRGRGVDAKLQYGVSNGDPSNRLHAHVWVTVDGEPVIGGAEAAEFSPVAAYP